MTETRNATRPAPRRAAALLLALLLCGLTVFPAPDAAYAAPNPNAALAAGSGMPQAMDITVVGALYPDAFPDANSRLRDFARALDMLSLRGTLTYRNLYQSGNRVHFDGDVTLNGRAAAAFSLDGKQNYLRLTSGLLGEKYLDLYMHNLYEFLLKPYFFMGMPTQYAALLCYPFGAHTALSPFIKRIKDTFGGDESRVFTAEEVTALAEYFARRTENILLRNFARALLLDVGGDELFIESLVTLPDWFAQIDPDGAGMTLEADGGARTWAIAGETLYAETVSEDGAVRAAFTPPESLEGYLLSADYAWTPGETGAVMRFHLEIEQYGEDVFHLTADADQLPCEGVTSATGQEDGKLRMTFGGRTLEPFLPDGEGALDLRYRWEKEKPRAGKTKMWLRVSWDHPETGLEAARVRFDGVQYESKTDLPKAPKMSDDFFSLNDDSLKTLLSEVKKPLITGLVPFVIELPWGVINTLFDFMDDYGVLDMLSSGN